jgi:hypothetical protein
VPTPTKVRTCVTNRNNDKNYKLTGSTAKIAADVCQLFSRLSENFSLKQRSLLEVMAGKMGTTANTKDKRFNLSGG